MAGENIDRFRDDLLAILRRDIIEPRHGRMPPIMAATPNESITHALSRDEQLIADLFWGSVEIWESQEALGDTEIYLSRNPYSKLGVSRTRYLRYVVTNYLAEIYVLGERIETFVAVLKKKYRRNSPSTLAAITKAGTQALKEIEVQTKARGKIVHERRFTTPELHELAGLEILAASGEEDEPETLARIAEHEFREQRKHWRAFVQKSNQRVAGILDQFFGKLHPVLFRRDGELIKPDHWPGP